MDNIPPNETETSNYYPSQFGDPECSFTESFFEGPFSYQTYSDIFAIHDNDPFHYTTLNDQPNTLTWPPIPPLLEPRTSLATSDHILETSSSRNSDLSPYEPTSQRECIPFEPSIAPTSERRSSSKRVRTEVSPDIPGSGCISFDGVAMEEIPNKGRKGRLTRPNRKKVANVRKAGACPRCRMRKISCSEIKPCNKCIKTLLGRPEVCWKAARCITFPLGDANVFTEALFAFPYVDIDQLDPSQCPAANEVIKQYFGVHMGQFESVRLVLCHQDFRDDITTVKCQQILTSVGGQLCDIEAGLNIEALPYYFLSTVLPLMEPAFSLGFRNNVYRLLGRYGTQDVDGRSFIEEGYCSVEKLVDNASIWYRSGTDLLKELESALDSELLIKCDGKRANMLLLYVLYMMLIVGKARGSSLPDGPPNEALESRVNTLLRSLTCALVLLHQILRRFPEDGLPLSSVESAVRHARVPYQTTVVPGVRIPPSTNPRREKGKRKRKRDEQHQPLRKEHDAHSVSLFNAKRSRVSSESEVHCSSISA